MVNWNSFSKRAVLLGIPLLLAISAQGQSDLPDGEGKDAVVKMCLSCHGAEVFTTLHIPKSAWAASVDDMVGRGAAGTEAEIAAVVKYLALHFGKQVNVNKATAEVLRADLSLTGAAAENIVAARAKNGPFHDLADLLKVPGVDKASLEEQKDNLVF
jgi:competence ComEA-like helix-hairpin-helix protein